MSKGNMTSPQTGVVITKHWLKTLSRHEKEREHLTAELAQHASKQESVENRYNQLVVLTKAGMEFLSQVQQGETITPEWISQAQKLVEQVQALMEDETTEGA